MDFPTYLAAVKQLAAKLAFRLAFDLPDGGRFEVHDIDQLMGDSPILRLGNPGIVVVVIAHGRTSLKRRAASVRVTTASLSCMSTPLHCAVGGFQHAPPKRWREVADQLLQAGADVNAGSAENGDPNWTPLHHAASRNHIAAVSWLLEYGADRTRVNKYGNMPLETARYFGHKEIVELLSAK